jgi:light-regulated signal transduction histidine kinase (bacteriophytochrome)
VGTADLTSALRQALHRVDARIHENNAQVCFDPLPHAMGDEGQLSHVFQNLLSNALKYRNHEAPRIHIRAEQVNGNVVVSVRDNGIGFDPAQADRIFGLFKRLHREDEYPGTGLGLAICKRIVERYGGKMWATGEEGAGATFFISLPEAQGE